MSPLLGTDFFPPKNGESPLSTQENRLIWIHKIGTEPQPLEKWKKNKKDAKIQRNATIRLLCFQFFFPSSTQVFMYSLKDVFMLGICHRSLPRTGSHHIFSWCGRCDLAFCQLPGALNVSYHLFGQKQLFCIGFRTKSTTCRTNCAMNLLIIVQTLHFQRRFQKYFFRKMSRFRSSPDLYKNSPPCQWLKLDIWKKSVQQQPEQKCLQPSVGDKIPKIPPRSTSSMTRSQPQSL